MPANPFLGMRPVRRFSPPPRSIAIESRVFPAGTHLADIPPEFRGMSEREWRISAAFEGPREAVAVPVAKQPVKFGERKLAGKSRFKYE